MAARAGSERRRGAAAAGGPRCGRAGTRAAGRAGGAGWRLVQRQRESRAEGGRRFTRSEAKTCGEVSESHRGGALGTRAGRAEGARGRGWVATGGRSAPLGWSERASERRGALGWECSASKGAARPPARRPRRCPELRRRAPPRSAGPAAPSRSRARGRIRSPPPRLAGPGPPGGSTRRGPLGCVCEDGSGQPLTSARRSRRPGLVGRARLPGPPGADRLGGGRAAREGVGGWDPPRGGAGLWACGFKEPPISPPAPLESWERYMGALLAGPSWDKLSGKSWLGRGRSPLRRGKTVSDCRSRLRAVLPPNS